jgi:hypothetical protein
MRRMLIAILLSGLIPVNSSYAAPNPKPPNFVMYLVGPGGIAMVGNSYSSAAECKRIADESYIHSLIAPPQTNPPGVLLVCVEAVPPH